MASFRQTAVKTGMHVSVIHRATAADLTNKRSPGSPVDDVFSIGRPLDIVAAAATAAGVLGVRERSLTRC